MRLPCLIIINAFGCLSHVWSLKTSAYLEYNLEFGFSFTSTGGWAQVGLEGLGGGRREISCTWKIKWQMAWQTAQQTHGHSPWRLAYHTQSPAWTLHEMGPAATHNSSGSNTTCVGCAWVHHGVYNSLKLSHTCHQPGNSGTYINIQ